jgi:enoyl-CoA hydratase
MASAMLGGLIGVSRLSAAAEENSDHSLVGAANRIGDDSMTSTSTVTIERRGMIVLIGINRPEVQNRIDPDTYLGLARALYQYDQDRSLRAAVLFGHGANFSRGIDVTAFGPIIAAGRTFLPEEAVDVQDPLEKANTTRLSKPLIAVVHGDTWDMAHEIFLNADIRIAATNTNFGQDENTHGRFPGGGSTVRFVREAGWGNAMRYMLTGDHWNAEEAYRMGTVQHVASNIETAMAIGLDMAHKIAACGPLGIKATLVSAHNALVPGETPALLQLDTQFGKLFHTHDFQEGKAAQAEGRTPIFQGN